MTGERVREFLDEHKVKYATIIHSLAYTSQEVAALAHISAKKLAKTVIVKVDGQLAMVVLPGHHKVQLDQRKEQTGVSEVSLASEAEFEDKFPECEVGAMPPFGNLYDMEVYISKDLTADDKIAFNAGSHSELIQMPYDDFAKLVQPKVVDL